MAINSKSISGLQRLKTPRAVYLSNPTASIGIVRRTKHDVVTAAENKLIR